MTAALLFWLSTSGPTLVCLCKPFSCNACPAKGIRQELDNLFVIARSISSACIMLDSFEKLINEDWDLDIKASSKECMPPRYSPEAFPTCDYVPVSSLRVLGHHISNDGSIREDWNRVRQSMWKAFWRNCGSSRARCLPLPVRLKLLERTVYSVVSYRFSRWPPQNQIALEVDQVQASMICYILSVRPIPGEEIGAFCRRRMRLAHAQARTCGTWSAKWFSRFLEWDSHLLRHPELPATRLRGTRSATWLQE